MNAMPSSRNSFRASQTAQRDPGYSPSRCSCSSSGLSTDEADGEGSPSRDVDGEARTLMPAFGAVGGLPQPQITTFEVHNSYAA